VAKRCEVVVTWKNGSQTEHAFASWAAAISFLDKEYDEDWERAEIDPPYPPKPQPTEMLVTLRDWRTDLANNAQYFLAVREGPAIGHFEMEVLTRANIETRGVIEPTITRVYAVPTPNDEYGMGTEEATLIRVNVRQQKRYEVTRRNP
jgi:hypothetical protein